MVRGHPVGPESGTLSCQAADSKRLLRPFRRLADRRSIRSGQVARRSASPILAAGSKRERVMIVYGSVVSPFVRKLLGYLGEKGIDFELKGVGIGDPDPGFQAASTLGKMPALDDDGVLLRSEGRRIGKECVRTCRSRLA